MSDTTEGYTKALNDVLRIVNRRYVSCVRQARKERSDGFAHLGAIMDSKADEMALLGRDIRAMLADIQ